MFEDKVLLITGGAGSFGNTVLRKSLNLDIKENKNSFTNHFHNSIDIANRNHKHYFNCI